MSARRRLAVASCVALGLAGAAAAPEKKAATPSKKELESGAALAKLACGSCHLLPAPDVLPRAAWRGEIQKMALLAADQRLPGWGETQAGVELSPDYQRVLAWYEAKAPLALPAPEAWPPPDGPLRFARHPIAFPGATTPEPAIANVRLADLEGDARPELLATDMRQGVVLLARPYEPQSPAGVIAVVPNPAHVAVVDLDGDGLKDLLVADLGEFFPGDHENGAVVWLRGRAGGRFESLRLGGFPRVADVESGDFDADGRLDLVVAAFGWRKRGGLTVLRRRADTAEPDFDRLAVDNRPGAIHVVPTDLDRDGKLDFVALIAQEHEAVVAFLGDGRGAFQAQTLYRAPHPNWGSSGLELVDFDGDGDQDVLVTNGDMFDDRIVKPYHGIQWLENLGRLRFEAHPLAQLPGVHRALARDLDGDGDLDVVAVAFVAGALGGQEARLASLVWLEQVKRGRFVKHTLEVGSPSHATLDVGDVDGDGDLDLVTGTFEISATSDRWLEVWENLGRPRP